MRALDVGPQRRQGPHVADGYSVVSGTTVLVDGATAAVLADALTVLLEAYRRRGAGLSPRIAAAQQAFTVAGDRHESQARFRRQNLGTAAPAPAVMVGDMTSTQVAARLGISPRAVTKRAHAFGGRKVAGRWAFAAADVEAEAIRREES